MKRKEPDMEHLTVREMARKWDLSERQVRKYCEDGRISGAFLSNNRWQIPSATERVKRLPRKSRITSDLKQRLRGEKQKMILGGIYHYVMIRLTSVSSSMEGGSLSEEQVRDIYEKNRITSSEEMNVDDIIECANHFRCIDMAIDSADNLLSQDLIKQFHVLLKVATSVSWNPFYTVGEYNSSILGLAGTSEIAGRMKRLLYSYNKKTDRTLEDLLDLYVGLVRIHPFRDSNGRIARLVLFKECLRNNIMPVLVSPERQDDFNAALMQYDSDPDLLEDVCIELQEELKKKLDEFCIIYD